ncbi:hypothetical protein D3C81_1443790 [compost metagenome]
MPEWRALPLQAHTTGSGGRLAGQRIFASGQAGALVLDIGALLVQANKVAAQLRLLGGVSLQRRLPGVVHCHLRRVFAFRKGHPLGQLQQGLLSIEAQLDEACAVLGPSSEQYAACLFGVLIGPLA